MTLDLDTFPSVAALCKEVEETTGKGVEFVFQPMHESQLSNQITARGLATHHIIRINERHRDLRHALASFQMRFILGRAKIKTPEKDLTANELAIIEIINSAKDKLDDIAARHLAQMIVQGLLVQVMSVVTGLRSHYDTKRFQPELISQHKKAMIILGLNNLTSLNPPNLPIPDKIIKWNKAMIAIENTGLAILADDNSLIGPLSLMGLTSEADKLVFPLLSGAYNDLDNRELIDLTVEHIGMKDYYRWVEV